MVQGLLFANLSSLLGMVPLAGGSESEADILGSLTFQGGGKFSRARDVPDSEFQCLILLGDSLSCSIGSNQ